MNQTARKIRILAQTLIRSPTSPVWLKAQKGEGSVDHMPGSKTERCTDRKTSPYQCSGIASLLLTRLGILER
jgi:hypothetical protein